MVRTSRLLLSAAVCGIIGFGAIQAQAEDVDIEATLSASPALTIGTVTDMDFASLDFAATHSGTITYGPDGVAALTATGLTSSGSPVAGEIPITESLATLDITCDATATISDGSVDLTIDQVVWDLAANDYATAAAANTCAGLGGTPVAVDTTVNNDPTIYVGARLVVGSDV